MSNLHFDAHLRVTASARPGVSARQEAYAHRLIYPDNGFNPPRSVSLALKRGWAGCCPACGGGPVVIGLGALKEDCPACGEALHHGRIGNAIALLVGPVALALALLAAGVMEDLGGLPLLLELAISEGIALVAALTLLPRAKGMVMAYAWSRYVGGFDPLRHLVPDPESPSGPDVGLPARVQARQ